MTKQQAQEARERCEAGKPSFRVCIVALDMLTEAMKVINYISVMQYLRPHEQEADCVCTRCETWRKSKALLAEWEGDER